jgi:hypothetical protein
MGKVWRSNGHCGRAGKDRMEDGTELSAVPSFDNKEGERLHESETEAKRARLEGRGDGDGDDGMNEWMKASRYFIQKGVGV